MRRTTLSSDPAASLNSPLGALAGARPPAPAWFDRAIAAPCERFSVDSDGAALETLAWGERGQPGLLLLHGKGAHAGWWSFLAPLLAKGRRVVAFSQSGMGRSDWREHYSREQILREPFAVAEAAGLLEGGQKPTFIGHSFGGMIAAACAAENGERLHAAAMVDSPLFSPDRQVDVAWRREQHMEQWRRRDRQAPPGNRRDGSHRVYATLAEALAHFRFLPLQPAENLYIVDYLARESLRSVPLPDGGQGFTWRFDPRAQAQGIGDIGLDLPRARCPLAMILAGRRNLISDADIAYNRTQSPPGTPLFEIPEAAHHIMVDQPLALVAALEALLTAWP
jgi:pimeloyl-ACP methyl ester carboxylesterase